MVYTFNPMTCEEPHLPDYEYSPIPKAVACYDCDCAKACDCDCDSFCTLKI